MKFQCCNCKHIFDEKDALCEDWNNPDHSFICPLCETCLIREDSGTVLNPDTMNRGRRSKRYLISAMIILLLIKPLFYLADRGPIGIFLICTAIAAIAVYVRSKPTMPERTYRVFRH